MVAWTAFLKYFVAYIFWWKIFEKIGENDLVEKEIVSKDHVEFKGQTKYVIH